MQIDDIIKIFKKNKGYLKSGELIKHKIHTSVVRTLVEQGVIDQIKRGLYRLPPDELPENDTFTHDYFDAAVSVPNGVFCLTTALAFHGLSTHKPSVFDIAIPPTHRNQKLYSVSVRFFRFQEPYYSHNVEHFNTNIVSIKMYDKEKTVCDAIRLRHLIGEDIAMEGLNSYIKQQKKDINKLLENAKFCKVSHIVIPAVKAMTGF